MKTDVRLYTWVDVEDVFARLLDENEWPDWLHSVEAYWDGVTILIREGSEDDAKKWVCDLFDPRIAEVEGSLAIIMESEESSPRFLRVAFESTHDAAPYVSPRPTFVRPARIARRSNLIDSLPSWPESSPPVVAFSSYKGGVGRTLHCIAMTHLLRRRGARVLLVDADFEAPGISWIVRKSIPDPSIAFADLLALVHSDPDGSARASLELAAQRVRRAEIEKGVFVLPAFRILDRAFALGVRPDHLVHSSDDPFVIAHILAELGKKLDVDVVIVDLRAGLSELAASLLLDPRVYRVFVSTPAGQSVAGTEGLMDLVAKLAPSCHENLPLPAVILAQVTRELSDSPRLAEAEERLLNSLEQFWRGTERANEIGSLPFVTTPYDSGLHALALDWPETVSALSRSDIVDKMTGLIEWLPGMERSSAPARSISAIRDARSQLAKTARELVYAESSVESQFLAIQALKNLAHHHKAELPICVIVGAKGAGKTYTFLRILERETWATFVREVGVSDVTSEALICPLVIPSNLQTEVRRRVDLLQEKVARKLGLGPCMQPPRVREYVHEKLTTNASEAEWRTHWLDIMAWSIGLSPGTEGAGKGLADELAKQEHRVIFLVDGLEDTFQDLNSSSNQQTALRALLQWVPEWLEYQSKRTVGLLVFVRSDMVYAAVKQNTAQLLARYEPYALKWGDLEALRLAAWVSERARVISELQHLDQMGFEELSEKLIPLWGRKLGSDRSREARSVPWILAALSDLRGQIQARDLVRFLAVAAANSTLEDHWMDRILAPTAIRKALPECSKEKIKEISLENPALGAVLEKLQSLEPSKKQIPFQVEAVGLTQDELQLLESNGVVLREGVHCYMPEIFRHGLGFQLEVGARPRVLTLARRAHRF